MVKSIKYCMWLLVIMLHSTLPPGINDSRGSIMARVSTREECYQIKERMEQIRFDNHRMSASCVFKGI